MADNLELLKRATSHKVTLLRAVASTLPDGRGAHLRTLIEHTVDRFNSALVVLQSEVDAVKASSATQIDKDRLLTNSSRKIERLGPQLDVAHLVLTRYQSSVNRSDVPIGLQHLIGVLIEQLVAQPADPIIYLNPVPMYSTVDLVRLLDELLAKNKGIQVGPDYADPHPIVFNLPALDPSNALLSPIIAHEVAHSAVEESLMADLQARTADKTRALLDSHLQAAGIPAKGPIADMFTDRFRDWCGELICDAVALALTGPAFVFAFAAFAPPTHFARVGTHPSVRDRVAFHLQVLERLGWGDFLSVRTPSVAGWLSSLQLEQALTGTPDEKFLREAMSLISAEIIEVSIGHVAMPMSRDSYELLREKSVADLLAGVPLVEIGSSVLSPWQIILSGWIARLSAANASETTFIDAVADQGFNQLLVKALELSSVVSAWRSNERPAV